LAGGQVESQMPAGVSGVDFLLTQEKFHDRLPAVQRAK
jgi:hypothetical protein